MVYDFQGRVPSIGEKRKSDDNKEKLDKPVKKHKTQEPPHENHEVIDLKGNGLSCPK